MGAEICHNHVRERITRLDRDVSVLRNRSQITPKTRDRINSLMRESAALSADLPERLEAQAKRQAEADIQKSRFAHGHQLYLEKQAPSLAIARKALCDLSGCALPSSLDTQITQMIAGFDHHATQMSHFSPSQGIPRAMQRLMSPRTL